MKQSFHLKGGFTLVETLLAVAISVMVFSAMGTLLVKTLKLWNDGAGQFYLANRARAVRARMMHGSMANEDTGPGTGLLSISEIKSVKTNPNWCTLEYQVASRDEKFWIQGSVDNTAPADKSVFIKCSKGGGQSWMTMVSIKRGQQNLPDVRADRFDVQTNRTLDVSYILSCEINGTTFEYPQQLRAYLINQ